MWWNEYIGIPYEFRGRDKDGADCFGIAEIIHKEVFGNNLEECKTEPVAPDDLREGDIVRLTEMFGGRVLNRHCGVVTGDKHILHTAEGVGSYNEKISKVKHKIKGVYRVVT